MIGFRNWAATAFLSSLISLCAYGADAGINEDLSRCLSQYFDMHSACKSDPGRTAYGRSSAIAHCSDWIEEADGRVIKEQTERLLAAATCIEKCKSVTCFGDTVVTRSKSFRYDREVAGRQIRETGIEYFGNRSGKSFKCRMDLSLSQRKSFIILNKSNVCWNGDE